MPLGLLAPHKAEVFPPSLLPVLTVGERNAIFVLHCSTLSKLADAEHGMVQAKVIDRAVWRQSVEALCAT